MEYENLKHLQKKDEFVADTDTTDALSQQPIQTERADSFSSTHSASYQILFHPEDDGVETHHDLKEGSLEEVQEEPPTADLDSAVYSHPQSVRLRSPERGEDGEGYTKVHVSSEMSQSIYQIPNAPTQPLSVELPPNSTSAVIDNSSREFTIQVTDNSTGEFTMQATNTAAPSLPVRRISDSVVSVQHAIGHPVAKKSLSVSSGTRGGSGFQTEPIINSVAAKPLIMKVLPLYLCMGDGKVYADKNAASIPTHHLVEVMGLEKSIALQEINNQLPPIPTPIISKETDFLTHPNPVYETVPRDLATRSNKAAVITDQPRIQFSPSVPPEAPPPPIQEPSRVSGTTDTSTIVTAPPTSGNVKESVVTQSNLTASYSEHKVIRSVAHEPSQASLADVVSPSTDRPTYVSTSEYYGGTSFKIQRREEVHSYYYFTIVAAIVVGLCLDFVVLLAFFLPALWFANKASDSKHRDNILEVKKFGRRALVLDIIGGILHILFIIIVAIGFITGVSVSLSD